MNRGTRTGRTTRKLAALALAAQMRGVALTLPINASRLPLPAHVISTSKRVSRRLARKAERRLDAIVARSKKVAAKQSARRKVLERRGDALDVMEEQRRLIEGMTNWQSCRWRRSGKGSKPPSRDLEMLRHFAALPHWKRAAAESAGSRPTMN